MDWDVFDFVHFSTMQQPCFAFLSATVKEGAPTAVQYVVDWIKQHMLTLILSKASLQNKVFNVSAKQIIASSSTSLLQVNILIILKKSL